MSDRLLMTAGWSKIEVVNLNTRQEGERFCFVGAKDLPAVAPELLYGGTLGGNVQDSDDGHPGQGNPLLRSIRRGNVNSAYIL